MEHIKTLTWEQWREKFISSLEASRILLENHKPVEAASRAYYAAYQMTGVLIKLKLSPRGEYRNWSHQETQEMYRIHICQSKGLGYKERVALSSLKPSFGALLDSRYKADYGFDRKIDMSLSHNFWRDANRLIVLLEKLVERGAL